MSRWRERVRVLPLALPWACSPPPDESSVPSLEEGGVVLCEEPELRDEFGPMESVVLGEGWTEQLGGLEVDEVVYGFGMAVGDIDDDGWLDIVLAHRTRPQIWMGGPGEQWVEEADRISVPEERSDNHNWSTNLASLVDVDGDGDLDLYLAFLRIPDQLYFNDGNGYFDNRTAESGLSSAVGGTRAIAWGDLDGDADLDLVLGANGPEDDDFGDPNSIHLNDGTGRFEEASCLFTEEERIGYTQAVGVADFDLDGHQDIYVINHHPEYVGNRMLFGDDELDFVRAPEAGADLEIQGMGLGIGDLNDDELPELLVADTNHLRLLMSVSDRVWVESSAAEGLHVDVESGQHAAWSTHFEDLDNDGLLDAAAVFGPISSDIDSEERLEQPDGLWLGQTGGGFSSVASDWGLADTSLGRSLALVDLDRDGYLDWLINPRAGPAKAWTSRCGENDWLILRLRQEGPNTHAIGSRVEIEAGGRVFRRWLTSGSTGLAVSHTTELHVGLGDNPSIDRLTVTWPDGRVDTWENLNSSQVIRIHRSL